MTTTDTPLTTPSRSTTRGVAITDDAVAQVRRVVRADAALCLLSGAVLTAGAAPLADLAGLDPSWPVAAAGALLLVLGAALIALARSSSRTLLALTPWSAEGDFAWALASIVVAVAVSLTGPGRALIAAQGLAVAAVGIVKLRAVRAARQQG